MRIALLSLLLVACMKPSTPAAPPSSPLVAERRAPRTQQEGKPPLLVLLHGIGSNERDLVSLTTHLDGRFAVASLRAPLPMGPDAFAWFSVQFRPGGDNVIDEGQWKASTGALLQAIDAEVAQAGADPSRVYLLGFSQGAMMAYTALLQQPGKVAGAVALSGRLLPQLDTQRAAPTALQDVPLLVVHGTNDGKLPVALARSAHDRLQGSGVALTYRELPIGHEVSGEEIRLVDGWLKERLAGAR